MVPHRFTHAHLAALVLLFCLVSDASAGDKYAYRPTYLIEDTKQGVAFWGPEGLVPNPEETFKRNARSFWYGSTQAFNKWGYYTFYRTGPVSGLDPSYWIEVLEKQWGPTAEEPARITLPETEALLFLFLPVEKTGDAWAIYSLLIPAGKAMPLSPLPSSRPPPWSRPEGPPGEGPIRAILVARPGDPGEESR